MLSLNRGNIIPLYATAIAAAFFTAIFFMITLDYRRLVPRRSASR